jgi:hypothetical protein
VPARFAPGTREALVGQGWRLATVPEGLTLAGVRALGAPFKGERFFREQAEWAREVAFPGGEVAYRPGLMPGSVGLPYGGLDGLLAQLGGLLPPGSRAAVASAAAYAWLLADHHARTGEWLLAQCFTWCADGYGPPEGGVHLVLGAMGGARPLLVAPLPEGSGRGVGLLPLVVPAGGDST